MRITNLNPAADVGASAWHVDLGGFNLLMDAGLHPKREGRKGLPLYEKLGRTDLDAIALSHCHHDHVGSLPVAMRRFPEAHVVMTEVSYFLAERVLHNSVNVMVRQRDELGLSEYPLFTHAEVDEQIARFQGFRYNREIEWAARRKVRGGLESPTLEFRDAGHTLGAAGVLVRGQHQTLFYTGDVSFRDQTLLRGARFEDIRADILIMETTRGSHAVPRGFSREKETQRLLAAVQATLKRRGSVLLPAFALGRTQEILALLALWMRKGRLESRPVHIGGLGRVFTEIYDLEARRTHRHHPGLALNRALNLSVSDRKQLERMSLAGGHLFVLTAGMMTEQTASFTLAERLLADERNAILLVGYTDPTTPGGRLRASQPGQPFSLGEGTPLVARHCEVQSFDLTAHADRDELLAFVGRVSPHTVVLGHGEPESRAWFAAAIHERHPRIKVLNPGPGETVEA